MKQYKVENIDNFVYYGKTRMGIHMKHWIIYLILRLEDRHYQLIKQLSNELFILNRVSDNYLHWEMVSIVFPLIFTSANPYVSLMSKQLSLGFCEECCKS